MRRTLSVLTVLGTSVLFAASAVAARPPAAVVPAATTVVYSPVAADAADDQEMQRLLDQLSALSTLIGQNTQSPQVWRTHLEQAEVLLQLAARTKGEDRDNWLRMAVESHYGAVVQSPENDLTAYQRLVDLPGQIAESFPGSPVIAYAAMQEIQADNIRMLQKDSNPNHAQHRLCVRLVHFAGEYPSAPEAPKAMLEAARISEAQGRKQDATRCYVYVIEHFPEHAAARKAEGGLRRLGQSSEPVRLELPLLFAPGGRDNRPFDLNELHNKFVVVYFWSSASPQAEQDFVALKQLTDRYQDRGLDVVYVNMDSDAAQGRAFLSGRLTAGVHLYQSGGLDGAVAERYGLQALPQAFLLARDGTLLRHSLQASQLEAEVAARLTRGR